MRKQYDQVNLDIIMYCWYGHFIDLVNNFLVSCDAFVDIATWLFVCRSFHNK